MFWIFILDLGTFSLVFLGMCSRNILVYGTFFYTSGSEQLDCYSYKCALHVLF